MAKNRITATDERRLKNDESITGQGLTVARLSAKELRYTLDKIHRKQRLREVLGTTSEGWSLDKAYSRLEEMKRQIDEGNQIAPAKERKYPKLFSEAAAEYVELVKAGKVKDKTKLYRVPTLVEFFKQTPLINIKARHADDYTHWRREKGLKDATIKNEINALSHFFTEAVRQEWITTRPKFSKPNPDNRREVCFTEAEIDRMYEEAKLYPEAQLYAFVFIGFQTAMRKMEILSLQIRDIDFDRNWLHVREAKTGSRYVTMSDRLAAYFREIIPPQQNGSDWLFPSDESKTGHRTEARKAWRRIVESIGLDPDKYTPHVMRHTVVTQMVQKGVDHATIMAQTGHKSLSTMMRYAHSSNERQRQAANLLNERANQLIEA
jgi:integrase